MKLGFALPVAGSWATPSNQVVVARRAEELGYHSLWTVQRLLYPTEPRNDYPSAPGQPWPAPFKMVVDPMVTLAHVAGATRTIRLGTAVVVAAYFAPAVLAKQLATLDIVCGGRLDVGIGVGWSEDEYEAAGVPFHRRGARTEEFLRCLHALWADDPVEFKGEFYSVPRSLFLPKPQQRPRPPILLGGYAPATVRRAVTLADGYLGGNVPLARVAPSSTSSGGRRRRRAGIRRRCGSCAGDRSGSKTNPIPATTAAPCGARSTRSPRTSPATRRPVSTSCSSS
jgi:probable F420-dependent oxidoreductase